MDDPWDVKSIRQSGQYISCMKLSGAPLLPPVLSRECRKEMQYYKLLAKEVEYRISLLQPLVSDTDSEATNDAPELPEHEQSFELAEENPQSITSNLVEKLLIDVADTPACYKNNDLSARENFSPQTQSPKPYTPPAREIPERDTDCKKNMPIKKDIELITEVEVVGYKSNNEHKKIQSMKKGSSRDSLVGIPLSQDGPSSLSSKSFTGSLNNLHSESIKDAHISTGSLIRQHSYTLLSPSPLLLAHLKVQSQNTGVEMNHISMSESLSNVSKINKKRRSWDLETAKAKWSTMALELKQKNVINIMSKPGQNKNIAKSSSKNTVTMRTAKSVAPTPTRRNNGTPKQMPNSEPIPKRMHSPVRNNISSRAGDTKHHTPKVNEKSAVSPKQATPISKSEDPALRVRELYEKIQKQQLAQMASLVEKQKKEQMLLQQVFEEQNGLLFKQLKTICPKSPIEVKEAWGDKEYEVDRGPVSLSQLINYKSPDSSTLASPASSTLTDTNNHLNHCDDVLRQSRNITGSFKSQNKSRSQNGTKIQSPRTQPEGSRTRTHSPVMRRLNYDTSISSDRDYDPMLTDRTNDTLADLNVTFPTDKSDDGSSIVSVVSHGVGKERRAIPGRAQAASSLNSTENAIKSLERNIRHSINSPPRVYKQNSLQKKQPTAEERAAATKIVAHVKGYLVRRLMVTERVQGTVQTIKDALLCALQLHQDREGIRGADVDLHRRLIQQITAACYTLHDTFIASTPAERCAMIAADRGRRRSLAAKQPNNSFRQTDIMSQSHSGVFPARAKRQPPSSLMTQSNYETFSGDKSSPVSRRYMSSPRRRPWR